MHHVWQVTPRVCSRVPGDRAGANGEVDVASCKYPSAVIGAGGGSRAARRKIGNRSIVPAIGVRIVAPCFIRGSVAAARVDIVAQGRCHEAMVGKWIVCSHRPRICGNIVYLNVKIRADRASGDAVDFAVQISRSMEIGGDGIRRQGCVVGIADWVVPPKRRRGVEVLIDPAEQIDIGSVSCAAKPATRRRKGGNGCPSVRCGRVLVSIRNSDIVSDAAETIDAPTY